MTKVVSVNPATGARRELDVEESSYAEVSTLASAAAAAAQDFAARSLSWRASLLRAMADELEVDGAALVEAAMVETALTRARLENELRRTAFQFRFFADVVEDGAFLDASVDHATESPMGPLPDLRRWRVPLGPVAVFGSSNFPFAFSVPGGDTASALAAGCPVVIKAHPAHPVTSRACFEALVRATKMCGGPDALLGLVYGVSAGAALVDEPAIRAVGFTGSLAAGRALWQRANARATPIPFFGELGSDNPLVVTARAAANRRSDLGAEIAGSVTLGAGQFCTKPGLIFLPVGEDGDAIASALAASAADLSAMTLLSEPIADHFRSGVHSIGEVGGVRPLLEWPEGNGAIVNAHIFEVDARDFVGPKGRALRDECFGPLAVVVRYRDGEELRGSLAALEPSLTFSVFVAPEDEDGPWLVDVAAATAGRVIVNGLPTGVAVSWSMHHGGPWPSTTSPHATSVGARAIDRWLRPVSYQGVPASLLPEALRDDSTTAVPTRVDGVLR